MWIFPHGRCDYSYLWCSAHLLRLNFNALVRDTCKTLSIVKYLRDRSLFAADFVSSLRFICILVFVFVIILIVAFFLDAVCFVLSGFPAIVILEARQIPDFGVEASGVEACFDCL